MSDSFADLPRGHFKAIYADPPWHFKSYAPPARDGLAYRRDVEKHYTTMKLPQIMALPVAELADDACHLFLWTTGPHLPQALELMAAWGFRYSAIAFTWIKLKRSLDTRQFRMATTADCDLHVGLGHTTRKNAEFCLLGRRGNARRMAKDVREIILSPVREHSRKPDEAHTRIERYCDGPYLELFARSQRPGWTVWGNQTDKFAPSEVAA
jgi:N6-adenosine-specific RNA methylase IME4